MLTYKCHFPAKGQIDKQDVDGYTTAFNAAMKNGPSGLLAWALQPQKGDVMDHAEIKIDDHGQVNEINLYMYADTPEFWEASKEDLENCVKDCLQDSLDLYGEIKEPIVLKGPMQYMGIQGNLPKTLYHIAERKELESILEKGLIPQKGNNDYKSDEDYIYLTDRQDLIPWLTILPNLDNPVILKINTKGLSNIENGRHFSDRDFTMPNGYGEYRTKNIIPIQSIKVMEFSEEDKIELLTAMSEQLNRAEENEKIEVARGIDRLGSMGICIHDYPALFTISMNPGTTSNPEKSSEPKIPDDEPPWDAEEEGSGLTEALGQMTLKDFGMNM